MLNRFIRNSRIITITNDWPELTKNVLLNYKNMKNEKLVVKISSIKKFQEVVQDF